MLIFQHVGKCYPNGYEALKNVNFTLAKGEMAFLTGHSGAGKSTLLRLIMLIERASAGQISLDDRDYARLRSRSIAHLRRRIGMVYQDHNLLADRNVFDNVAMPLVIAGLPPREIRHRVEASLEWMGLASKAHMLPITLSGGEQQRVGIARAVVHRPQLLLADEPTGNLDADLAAEIMDLFHALSQAGMSVLVATHDLHLTTRYEHRILHLKQGHLQGESR